MILMLECPFCDGFIGVNDNDGIALLALHIDDHHYKDRESICYGIAVRQSQITKERTKLCK